MGRASSDHKTGKDLIEIDLTSELWREYDIVGRPEPWRIEQPQKLFIRPGGTTHRVVDATGRVHCIPFGNDCATVLCWESRDSQRPVNF
jgi:hypothetical protein